MQIQIGKAKLSFFRKAPQTPGLYFWRHPGGLRIMTMLVVWKAKVGGMLIADGHVSADVTQHDGWFCGPFPSDSPIGEITIWPSSDGPDSPPRSLKNIMTDIYQLTDELRYQMNVVGDEAAKAGLKNLKEMGTCDVIRLAQLIIAAERIKP